MKRAISSLSVSILLAMSMVGCDNSAKTADKATETKAQIQPHRLRLDIVIGRVLWHGK
jgi:NitT/TauT family transport system substrate-binding protein